MTSPNYLQVLLSLALVVVSIILVRHWRIPVAKDMALGSIRAFIQLIAVGYALEFIFDLDSLLLISLAILIMIIVGAYTASGRVKQLDKAFPICFFAMVMGSLVTLGIMLAIRIIPLEARYIIPLGGMIISNAMNASTLSMTRLVSDIKNSRLAIETSLALGKSWRTATRSIVRESALAGMISMLNFMKTVGIVALPGAMTGMILGGADPLEAVLLQVVVAYMLLSAVTITSILSVEITIRRFFTVYHQLKYS